MLQIVIHGESFSGVSSLEGANGESGKRALDDPHDSREAKRSRFEVIE